MSKNEKDVTILHTIADLGWAIQLTQLGFIDHWSQTEKIWTWFILTLVTEYELKTFEKIPLYTNNEDEEIDSIYGMGRVFLGGRSAEGAVHTQTMRNTDITLLERFLFSVPHHLEHHRKKKASSKKTKRSKE